MFEVLITSSFLICVLALFRRLWKSRVNPVLQYMFWLIVAVRLLIPIPVFGNGLSIMNVAESILQKAETWTENREIERKTGNLAFLQGADAVLEPGTSLGNGYRQLSDQKELQENVAKNVSEQGESIGAERTEFLQKEDGETMLPALKTPAAGISVWKLVRYLWYAGMGIMAAVTLTCNLLFQRRLIRERQFLCKRGRVCVYITRTLESPCLYGILHPAVYLTVTCPEDCREHAIVHELTHYSHGDHVWILIRRLCTIIYWFDPFVWLAAWLSARDCELACDAGVIRRLGEGQRETYGCTLIRLAGQTSGSGKLLRCATGLSGGKKELKERITMIAAGRRKMRSMAGLAAVCAALLTACTFGSARPEENTGRYVEETVEPGFHISEQHYLVQEGANIRLMRCRLPLGKEWLSTDGGVHFEEKESVEIDADWMDEYGAAPDGSRIFAELKTNGGKTQYEWHLISGSGASLNLEVPGGSDGVRFFYGGGSFYAINTYREVCTLYRIEPETGVMQSLLELPGQACYLTADDRRLCLVQTDGVLLYDLEAGRIAERQDDRLSAYLAGMTETFWSGWHGEKAGLYLEDDTIYILTRQGLVRHVLYSEDFELMIDGNTCSLGDSGQEFRGMALVEEEGQKEFLILLSDEKLLRYRYTTEPAPEENVLRVYSAYEDADVRHLVAAFRKAYPEVQIRYEVGVNTQYGGTYEDALRSLATELAAGTGPDILFVDELPYRSYVEKGALLELSDLRKEMSEETYFTKIIDGMATEQGLYVIPLSFLIPVWGGQTEEMAEAGEISSLEEWAELLVQTASENPDNALLGILNEENLFSLLSAGSMADWVRADGELDMDKIEAFLVQAKRIYDSQLRSLPEEYRGLFFTGLDSDSENWVTRQIGKSSEAAFTMDFGYQICPQHPFWIGYLHNAYVDISNMLEYGNYACRLLPGQAYGRGLPVSQMAVNAGSARMEECRTFLEYALSEEFQRSAKLYGFPVNRMAFRRQQKERPQGELYTELYISQYDGSSRQVEFRWPNESEFAWLDELADGIAGVNSCEYQVYRIVAGQAVRAIRGECEVEEAVTAMEKSLSIYMAE